MATASQASEAPQPLIIKPRTIALDKDEQALVIPFSLRMRVAHAKYTWRLFLGATYPNNEAVSPGDVWVTTVPGHENIFIRSESNEWKVWHKTINYGAKRYCNDANKFLHSYHPWLRDRLLQFNGTDLGWHPRRMFSHHRTTWNTKYRSKYPDYETLDSVTVARYMKVVHLRPRPPHFAAQPAAPTCSSVPSAAVARPVSHPVHPGPLRPTAPAGVQVATPISSTSQQPATVQPVQRSYNPPKLAVPGGVQPASLPPATTTHPSPNVRPAASSSSANFAPAVPAQPPVQGPTTTGVHVQPAATTSSTSSILTAATSLIPRGQPMTPQPTSIGAIRTSAPSSTSGHLPAPTLPAQTTAPQAPEPLRHKDVVSATTLKRQRSSSALSYASKERSPSPKRPNLGEEVKGPADAIREQPSQPSRPDTARPATPLTPAALPASNAASASAPPAIASPPAPAPAIPPSSTPSVQPPPVPAHQPSPVSTVQPGSASATRQPPTPPVQISASLAIQPAAEVPSEPSQASDADLIGSPSIVEKVPNSKSSPPDPPGIDTFLGGLPLSLSRHAAVFTSVGVANMDHVRLLAQLPKVFLDKFLAMVRERGLSFMESLVLRSALNGVRQPYVNLQAPAEPTTVDGWLEQIGPSMARHAEVFRDLGIETAHIPVLAQLDAESFQEFENALEAAGLTWIHRFAITARIRDGGQLRIKQEPFLVA